MKWTMTCDLQRILIRAQATEGKKARAGDRRTARSNNDVVRPGEKARQKPELHGSGGSLPQGESSVALVRNTVGARPLPASRSPCKSGPMGRFVFLTAVGIWLGTVVSFTLVLVPLIRATLHPKAAWDLLRKLFPRYYTLGVLCGLTGLAAISLLPGGAGLAFSHRVLLAFPVSLSLLCAVLAQYYIHPRMAEVYDRAPEEHERLSRLAALLNDTVLLMLVFAFATFATR